MQKQIRPCDDEIWAKIKGDFRSFNVFVNIPYVEEYRDLEAAIIATLLKTGMVPQLAAFRSEGQPIRICKICEMMQSSKYCITDLSYSTLHNMPFELGYMFALGRQAHSFILIDEKYAGRSRAGARKFDAQMSNLKGVEIIVHERSPKKLVSQLLRRMKSDVPEAQIPNEIIPLVKDILTFANRTRRAIEEDRLDEFVATYGQLWQAAREPLDRAHGTRSASAITRRG
jgi:hypothetical protein